MKKTLIVMAAGMGSRFGGLKQLEGLGPEGQMLLEYSAYDASRFGFDEIVFVIRKQMEADFKELVLPRVQNYLPAKIVFQELDTGLPIAVPEGREKPWGTGHAVLVAKEAVSGPFAVINADDFYGAEGFHLMSECLQSFKEDSLVDAALVAYELKNTLSENGAVSRGICKRNGDGPLLSITEHTHIERREGRIVSRLDDGREVELEPETLVSMNFWGFSRNFFTHLERAFHAFLSDLPTNQALEAEFYLPFAVDALIQSGTLHPAVLRCHSEWLGVTYPGDADRVRMHLAPITGAGKQYPLGKER